MLLFHRAGPGAALEGYTWELTIYAIPIRHKINQIDALKVNLVPNICVVYLKKKKCIRSIQSVEHHSLMPSQLNQTPAIHQKSEIQITATSTP